MDRERWSRVDELYHQALDKPPGERTEFLAKACGGDSSLRQEVESLLSFGPGADSGLQAAVRAAAIDFPGLVSAGTAPAKLGRYEVEERIGKGGMGVVYRAIDPAIGRTVAIKTIAVTGDGEQGSALRARLLRESQAGGRLSHPNIVAVHDVCQEGDTAYIVMEYVQGSTLSQFMQENASTLLPSEITRIVKDCAAALDYAHANGVVHRDVKPSNIMLQPGGAVKIADFGIAKVAQSAALTQSSAAIGSPEYMAPEQWRGEAVTGQTDQYALATIAYFMLAGRRPFTGDSVASLAALTLHQNPPAATTFNARLSSAVDKVLQKALAKNPGSRYPTCGEFALALDHAVQAAVPTAPARSQKVPLAIAVFVLLAALCGLGWVLWRRAAETPKNLPAMTQIVAPTSQAAPQLTQPDDPPEIRTPATTPKKTPAPRPTPLPVSKSPQDSEAEGDLHAKQEDYREAVQSFTKAIAAAPGYRPYFNRASAYQHLSEFDKAIDDYSQALHYKPDSALAFHDRALCEMRLNRVEDASRDYDEALKLQPNNPRTWNARGAIYLKQGLYRQAIDFFAKAIELDPGFAQAYQNRAAAEKASGDAHAAETDAARAKALQ